MSFKSDKKIKFTVIYYSWTKLLNITIYQIY